MAPVLLRVTRSGAFDLGAEEVRLHERLLELIAS
jgi:hypothetical protein